MISIAISQLVHGGHDSSPASSVVFVSCLLVLFSGQSFCQLPVVTTHSCHDTKLAITFAMEFNSIGSADRPTAHPARVNPPALNIRDVLTAVQNLVADARLFNDTIGPRITTQMRIPLLHAYVKLAYIQMSLDLDTPQMLQNELQRLRLQLRALLDMTGKYNQIQGTTELTPSTSNSAANYSILVAELGAFMIEIQDLIDKTTRWYT